jgi:hypothetical protein
VQPNSSEQIDVLLEHMAWVQKHGLQKGFPQECEPMKALWVAACCRSLFAYNGKGMTSNRWLAQFHSTGSLLLGSPTVNKLLENSEGWEKCEAELTHVVSANDFGQALFARQAQQLFKARLGRVAQEVVDMLLGAEIINTTISVAKAEFDKRLTALGAKGDTTLPRRQTLVLYGSGRIPVEVVSVNDEFKVQVQG